MIVDVPLTAPQKEFVFSQDKHVAIVGGLGSGKSRAGTIRLILRMLSHRGANAAYYMPTYDLLKLRAMPGIEEDLRTLGIPYKTNYSDYLITVIGYGSIIFRSYEKPERIIAYEVADSIVDEIDTLKKDKAAFVWRKIVERNRQKVAGHQNTIAVVTTPDQGVNGFVYDKWVKKQQPGYAIIKASTASNPYLPDDYIDNIKANYDPVLAQLYLDGEFVSLSQNKVYHFFDRRKHHTNRQLLPSDQFLYVGLDFNIGGTCAVVAVIDAGNPVFVEEFVSHDTHDFCNQLASRYQGKTITVYPDASGQQTRTNASRTDVAIIESNGFFVDCPKANPAIRDRINSLNAGLAHGRIAINTDKCPNLTHALETQGYTDKNEPEKYNDHPAVDDWVDACGYLYHRRYPVDFIKPLRNAGYWK